MLIIALGPGPAPGPTMHAGEASFPRCTSDQTGTNVQPQSSHLFVRSQSAAFQRTKSAAEEQAEKSMELIMQLKAVRKVGGGGAFVLTVSSSLR